ncbi:hypothetical protein [Synechococcus sp. CS-205]|nr:hypothetical protein [Synechococcus sp. CS-205]MCT0248141.1 hypothetical protein [Synechococcus sp. CS-205]
MRFAACLGLLLGMAHGLITVEQRLSSSVHAAEWWPSSGDLKEPAFPY